MGYFLILVSVIIGYILGRIKDIPRPIQEVKNAAQRILEATKSKRIKVFKKKEPKPTEEEILDQLNKNNA